MVMRILASMFVAGLLVALALPLAAPQSADAAIHEKIAAACRKGGEEVVPPGQVRDGMSFLRALQATGIIESIVPEATKVTITFDLSKPSSKYVSGGDDLTIPDFFGEGVDLVLSPPPVPNPEFAAHANCKNMNP